MTEADIAALREYEAAWTILAACSTRTSGAVPETVRDRFWDADCEIERRELGNTRAFATMMSRAVIR